MNSQFARRWRHQHDVVDNGFLMPICLRRASTFFFPFSLSFPVAQSTCIFNLSLFFLFSRFQLHKVPSFSLSFSPFLYALFLYWSRHEILMLASLTLNRWTLSLFPLRVMFHSSLEDAVNGKVHQNYKIINEENRLLPLWILPAICTTLQSHPWWKLRRLKFIQLWGRKPSLQLNKKWQMLINSAVSTTSKDSGFRLSHLDLSPPLWERILTYIY